LTDLNNMGILNDRERDWVSLGNDDYSLERESLKGKIFLNIICERSHKEER